MKRIHSLTLLALLGCCGYVSAESNLTKTEALSQLESEQAGSWERLQETLRTLNTTQGKEAPSLGLTFVVNETLYKVDLKPAELLGTMKVVEAARASDWTTVAAQSKSATVRHLLPAAAEMLRIHEVASRSPAVQTGDWAEALETNDAYVTLFRLVQEQIETRSKEGRPYIPGVLVSAESELSETMRAHEDELFERWDSIENVRSELMNAETATLLLKSLGRYPRGNREIFNHFLTSIAEKRTQEIWATFDAVNGDLAQSQASNIQPEIVRSTYLALEKARQNSARPQNLFVEVFSGENQNRSRVQVNEPISIQYSYDIGREVPHTLWLSIRDKDDTIIYEKTLDDLAFDNAHQRAQVTLPGLSFAGNFKAQLTIRNQHGHFTDSSDSFRVVENLAAEDQERYETLDALFGAANERANSLVERLQKLADEYDALHPELLAAAGSIQDTADEIEADNMVNTPEENIAKWLRSGRYNSYTEKVESYNEDVNESDALLAEGKALRTELKEIEELTQPLARALDEADLDAGLQAAADAVATDDLGYADKVEELAGATATRRTTEADNTEVVAEAEVTAEVEAEVVATTETTEITEAAVASTTAEELEAIVAALEETVAEVNAAANEEIAVEEIVAKVVAEETTTEAVTAAVTAAEESGSAAIADQALISTYQEEFVSAILGNNLDAAERALANGANINFTDEATAHILHQVVTNENLTLETVQFLVQRGADVYASDAQGNGLTPMMALATSTNQSGDREAVLRYFIEQGVRFNAMALRRVQDKENRLESMREAVRVMEQANEGAPYLYSEAVSLMEEAEANERNR